MKEIKQKKLPSKIKQSEWIGETNAAGGGVCGKKGLRRR